MNNFELILKNFQPEAAVSRDRGAATPLNLSQGGLNLSQMAVANHAQPLPSPPR